MTSRAAHDARREATYLVANAALSARAPFRFGGIDAAACDEFRRLWKGRPKRPVDWDWHHLAAKLYAARYARLEAAIWSGPVLCGLVLGRFSRAGTVLQLNYIEGAPGSHPLKGDIVNLGVTFAELLGTAYRASALRVTKPEPHVVQALSLIGYQHVARSRNPPYYNFSERSLP